MNIAVTPGFSWPSKQIEIQFEGYIFVLQPCRKVPETLNVLSCTVSVFDETGISFEVGGTVASRFMSRLAWSRNGGIVELFSAGSNNPMKPGRLGVGTYGISGYAQVEPWDYLYFPLTETREADLALGLFREGMSVNSVPFSFLSYFKVLNIKYGSGASQKNWINSHIEYICAPQALDRLTDLKEEKLDIGKYLYEEGRCAVAHAHGQPLVNPDNYIDKSRMHKDLPLMKELATLFIEKELGILSNSSFWEGMDESSQEFSKHLLKKVIDEDGRILYRYNHRGLQYDY